MSFLNAIPASDFISMVYISENKVPLENTWAYIFPYKDFCSSIVSDIHIPSNRFLCNSLFSRYLRDNGITANCISHFVVMFIVYFSCSVPIFHHFLRYYGDTNECIPLDWNIFACGVSFNSTPNRGTFLGIYRTFTMEINLFDRVPMSYRYRDWLSGSLSKFSTKWKASPWVLTSTTFLEIYSFTACYYFEKWTFYIPHLFLWQ